MKTLNTLYKAILFLFISTGISSCKLDETIYSSIFTEAYYQTASDAEKALVAVYGSMGGLYGGPAALLVPDFSDDQTYPRAVVGRNTLTLFTIEPTYTTQRSQGRISESPEQIWTSAYQGIERANWIIAKVPETQMDETRKQQIIGEAHFMRAFYHWMLAKNFGEIPVKIVPSATEEQAYTPKSTLDEVYAQIYVDLDMAYNAGLPSFPAVEPGRPSRETVNALYAKAALYHEDWDTALQKAELVLTSGAYTLIDDAVSLFHYANEEEARKEVIWAFEVDAISPGNGHQLVGLMGPSGSGGVEYGRTTYGSMFAYMAFFNSFDEADERRLLLDTTYLDKSGNWVPQRAITPITPEGVLIKKYQDPVSTTSSTRNIPIFRLADIYLIAAEAEARLNGPTAKAYGYVNTIRNRAGLGDLDPGLSQEGFVDAVIQERAWEFFAEGDRWYDLTRTGKFLEVIPNAVNDVYPVRNVQPKNRYFPIPQDEINANPELTQNPDWN
ncbi:RagB/SusD family nutrient uptake outer membrane protein [Parapedobacter sp. DT-150]|uniref:RagB/SusD family nutrient uptake outer membrane protein n=1 Tax=Parapedobacter sp. DT-150 TaxID=3396162 RepID=UPI003F1C00F6